MSVSKFGRHDVDDRFMVAAAKPAFDLALPTEAEGTNMLSLPDREVTWVRSLFEKSVGGFFEVVLNSKEWRVQQGWLID